MPTDWVLIWRAALELGERFAGARLLDAGLLPDGRIALVLRGRAATSTVAFDLFSSPPLVTVENAELAIGVEPGFVRKLATTLRGMTLQRVSSRRGDRLLRLDFGSRSRFGVGDAVELYVELVPRFGNLVLVKRGTIVAALKEFSLADNPARAVQTGMPYALPPLPHGVRAPRSLTDVPDESQMRQPLYTYRDAEGRLLGAHVVPLAQFPEAARTREPSLLDLFSEARGERVRGNLSHGIERRRAAILRRLADRRKKLESELTELTEKRRAAERRAALREEGESIFAALHELPERERDEAKERAAKLFARYKKLQSSIPHLEQRERSVGASIENLDVLRWEAERAADDDVDDVESAVAALDARASTGTAGSARKKRKRAPLEFRTAAGSRIVVGRSPTENADVTFRIARPDDLWFHAQGIPGAHVVLARDDRTPPPAEDISAAASLAAFHSKARGSKSVAVDYTHRKYVRKQQKAPPGLVWYTHPTTVLAEPTVAAEMGLQGVSRS